MIIWKSQKCAVLSYKKKINFVNMNCNKSNWSLKKLCHIKENSLKNNYYIPDGNKANLIVHMIFKMKKQKPTKRENPSKM